MSESNILVYIFLIAGGAYVVYQGFAMESRGKLTSRSLVSKKIDLKKARDIPGFIQRMYLVYIICGILFASLGVILLYMDFSGMLNQYWTFYLSLALLVDISVFAACMIIGQRKYLSP